jgi:ribosomal protein S18 acetylase RimI-like enzyme
MDKIKILKGEKNFKDDFVNLILYTGKDLFFLIFGKDVKEILKKLFIEKRNQFSHEFTYFILLDEKISGMVLSYSYDEKNKVDLNTGYLLIKIMKLNFLKIFPNLIKSYNVLGKIDKEDYYISNIAIYPEYRGIGLGKKLLNFIEDLAKNRKLKRIVLEVEKENLNAIKVYENFGFKKEEEILLKIDRKIFSFYKMIKTI